MTEETHSNEVVDNTTNEVVENKNELKVLFRKMMIQGFV